VTRGDARRAWRGTRTGRTVLCVAVTVLVACGGSGEQTEPPPPPAIQQRTLEVGGLSRTYRLFAPLSLDRSRPAPLVLMLHGVGNSAQSMVEATQFDRTADTAGFIVAYPEGVNQTWNAGYCCLGGASSAPDDVAFLGRVIDDVQARHTVDPARVFAVGVSAGGMMAYRLGCELSGRVTGVGAVAGGMILDECRPTRPVSVIEIHGTADPLVPYEGGHTAGGATQPSPPTVALVERWAELNRCPMPSTTQTEGPVRRATWGGCAEGSAVKLVTIEGGGHTWFAPGLGTANGAVDATAEIWAFLSGPRR
jgi:polyhydroxybutyrate depolymerase